jgi:hypothetical protein
VTLSSPRQKVGRVFLGVDGRGVAVAAWHWGTGTRPSDPGYVGQVQLAERPLGGEWGGPTRASQDPGCLQVRRPRVAVGASGHAVVWWQCDLGRSRSVAAAVARGPDEPFGTEARLPISGGREVAADLAVTPDGQAVAVSADDGALRWWRGPASAGGVSLSPLPALGTAERLAAGVGQPQVAAGDAGDAVSGWIAPGRTTRIAPIAGDLGVAAPITLGGGRADARVRVAMGGARRGAVAWLSAGRVVAVGRGPDGNTGPRAVLSGRGVPASEPPSLAMDTAGDGLVLWARRTGGRSVIERAEYASP